jgi:hypothetical protein
VSADEWQWSLPNAVQYVLHCRSFGDIDHPKLASAKAWLHENQDALRAKSDEAGGCPHGVALGHPCRECEVLKGIHHASKGQPVTLTHWVCLACECSGPGDVPECCNYCGGKAVPLTIRVEIVCPHGVGVKQDCVECAVPNEKAPRVAPGAGNGIGLN